MHNGIKDFESIVAFLSKNNKLSGYSQENQMKWVRIMNPNNGDVEKPYPFMIRRLLKNYQPEVEKRKLLFVHLIC